MTNKCLDSVCFGQFPFFPATESPVTQEQNQASASLGAQVSGKQTTSYISPDLTYIS